MRKKRQPTTPGEILREEFLVPLEMTQKELADHLGCDVKVINRLVNGRTSVSAEMALKLGATFRTSPEFWLNAQKAIDLYRATARLSKLPPPVTSMRFATTTTPASDRSPPVHANRPFTVSRPVPRSVPPERPRFVTELSAALK